ncbi:MAG: ABC transporter ATP-binding protein [Actinomycetes bacterium]
MSALIETRDLCAGYGATLVVHDVNIEVHPGEVVGILGANGAGKTTTLLALAGELPLASGQLLQDGQPLTMPLHRRARKGLAFVTEERSVFMRLTTRQNLGVSRDCDVKKATALFRELAPLMSRRAGLLSGGEQQMLTLARALARPTKLLLADELSLGLAPLSVERLINAVRSAADEGMGALLVEQHVHQLLRIADRIYVMRRGHVVFSGTAAEARAQLDEIRAHYLTQDVGDREVEVG